MRDVPMVLVTALYFCAMGGLVVYGLNCYVMIFLFRRRRSQAERESRTILERFGDPLQRADLPVVTTQIPVYNEVNVVERVLCAAAAMRYAPGKHEIQVLDDSNDETSRLIDAVAGRLRATGVDIQVVRRDGREGFKAGALAHGLRLARGELIAVFDADFVPPEDFLLRSVPFLVENPKLGLAQARWGHLNRNHSLLTQAQSIGIDGHFMIEQSARTWNGLFMNFNGTAGVWRREAIEDSGGWQWDTLTEDMDLSYRVQLKGWETRYLIDLVVPAEIPEDMAGFRSQQFRWAKGSIQTAKKLLPSILRSDAPVFKKAQAFLHLTHYAIHPMMLIIALLALPVLLSVQMNFGTIFFCLWAVLLILVMCGPSTLYVFSQRAAHGDWLPKIACLPGLVLIGTGISYSNARAVFEALIGRESPFVRTPKRGDRERKCYRRRLPWEAFPELALGVYCAFSFNYYCSAGEYLIGPFLAVYTGGFLLVGTLTILHAAGVGISPSAEVAARKPESAPCDGKP